MSFPLECQCTGAGFCQARGKYVTEKEQQLCSCTIADPNFNDEAGCLRRRQRWHAEATSPSHKIPPTSLPAHEPTTALKTVPLRWVSTAQLAKDAVALAALLPPDITGIAGIPRSGLIAAGIIAVTLHLPLFELDKAGELLRLGNGWRGQSFGEVTGRLAVIDDTVYSGSAMSRARKQLAGSPHVFGAVYVRPESAGAVDLYAVELPSPHLLEWNCVNNAPLVGRATDKFYQGGIALDLDGIICHDDKSGGKPGTPYLLPRMYPCPLIVTGRYESQRAATEAWLTAHGVRWGKLEMLPNDSPNDLATIAAFKAGHFTNSTCNLFLESNPEQAAEIHKHSNKPVVCPATSQAFPTEYKTVAPPPVPARAPVPQVKPRPAQQPISTGPGTQLKKLLAQMGITPKSGCGCQDKARTMDAWGVQKCRERKEEIVKWLKEQQQKQGWKETLAAGAKAVTSGLVLNPLDPLGHLVDKAIEAAEAALPKTA